MPTPSPACRAAGVHPQPGGAETGVTLSFRYKLDQTATYEFDEYSRVLVKVDGVQYGRGAKNYVDHVGGDGSSTQGNTSSYLPTTDWQQLPDLPGRPGGGQPHDRPGRLQQQEGCRRRVDHRGDRRRAGDQRECGAGSQRRADAGQPGEHQPVPGLQPGHCAVRRPLPRQRHGLFVDRLYHQLHERAGVGGGAAPGHGLHHGAPQLHLATAVGRTCMPPRWGR